VVRQFGNRRRVSLRRDSTSLLEFYRRSNPRRRRQPRPQPLEWRLASPCQACSWRHLSRSPARPA